MDSLKSLPAFCYEILDIFKVWSNKGFKGAIAQKINFLYLVWFLKFLIVIQILCYIVVQTRCCVHNDCKTLCLSVSKTNIVVTFAWTVCGHIMLCSASFLLILFDARAWSNSFFYEMQNICRLKNSEKGRETFFMYTVNHKILLQFHFHFFCSKTRNRKH